MAIPRMFNSNTPFIIITGGSELSFRVPENGSLSREEETDSLVQTIGPHLTRVMQHGTAKHVMTEGLEENVCVSIVAQAEREDFQEFSPSNTQCPYSGSQLLLKHRALSEDAALISDAEEEDLDERLHHLHLHRKQRRKTRSRQKREEDGEEPPVIQGLWVQEIDWLKTTSSCDIIPPPPQFTDSCCHDDQLSCTCGGDVSTDSLDTSSSDDKRGSDCESVVTREEESDSDLFGVQTNAPDPNSDLMHVSGFNSSDPTQFSQSPLGCSGSSQKTFSSDVTTRSEFDELKGRVMQIPKLFVSALFRTSMKLILDDWKTSKPANEGLLFHHLLQPSNYQYREDEEFCVLHHIQNGSYGDVFCVQDKSTGFKCAAKRIPLGHFSSEEVTTWSCVNSPRVVDLFGAVRDGLNVVLFMDLKPACLAQLLKEMSFLPEDLALHYLHQTLGALEHLHHRKLLHLDVKADNVLLSADCRDTFLCDFGLSQMLDSRGQSSKAFRGAAFPGTETHMAPEVARSDRVCAKADVWSSCCMLLHMLNGCQPWIRYYSHPLCFHIVNEPPPLWEVPSNCNNFTAKVFRSGLQKDPNRRASAQDLRRKTTKALRAVGGLSSSSIKAACEKLYCGQHKGSFDALNKPSSSSSSSSAAAAAAPDVLWVSPWRTLAVDEDCDEWDGDASDMDSEAETDSQTEEWDSHPRSLRDSYSEDVDWESGSESEVDIYMGEEEFIQEKWLKTDKDYEGDWEDDEEWDSSASTEYLHALRGLFPLLQKGLQTDDVSWGSEAELEYLRDDVPEGTMFQTPSPEPRDEPPSCFSCSDSSQTDASEEDSDRSSDDLSSGVFSSCNGHTGAHVEWLTSSTQPSSRCFEGVDIWIENVQGACLRIREHRRVKVGHVAIGISGQMSGKAFTLETLDRKMVSFEEQIEESGLWFCCVPAPDRCQRWRWRVRDNRLELRE